MADFKWNKDEFGELAEIAEKRIQEAIAFGMKNADLTNKTKISELEQQLQAVQTEYQGFKTNAEIENALLGVNDKNKEIIKELIGNDVNKIAEVKTKYSHLFQEPKLNVGIGEVLEKGVNLTNAPLELDALKEKIAQAKATPEEEAEYVKLLEQQIK